MSLDGNLLMIAGVGLLTAVGCWALLYGLLTLWGGREARVRARIKDFVIQESRPQVTELQQRKQQRAALFSQLDSRWAEQSWMNKPFQRLTVDMAKADMHITVTELFIIQVSVAAGLALVLWLLAPAYALLVAPLGFVSGLLLFRSYLRHLGKKRQHKFEDQLPDLLSILAGSVRGGFSLFQALQLIAREAAEPSRTEFQRIIHEVSLGGPLDEALAGLAKRMPTEDVDILVTAITLQHQTGGNLSHVLDIVANTIRERHRVEREIRSMTAQQRFSASLLAALPFMLAAVLYVISPGYISHIFEWGWVLCMPVGAVILSVIGLIVMRRIATIDV